MCDDDCIRIRDDKFLLLKKYQINIQGKADVEMHRLFLCAKMKASGNICHAKKDE